MKFRLAVLVALVISSALAGAMRISEPPTVDGKLDEKIWADAAWETGFRRFRNCPQGRDVKADTSFAILADAENVYFAAKCAEPDMAAVRAEPPTGIFGSRQNSIELVFAPDGTSFDYYQFVMTFRGETYAMFYSEGGNIRPDPYGPAWESRIGEWEGGWTIEARIPLAAFYMTRDANWRDEWLLGVSRTRSSEGFSSWCDFEKGFKEPKNYRRYGGFPKRRIEEDVWVKSVDADIAGRRNGKVVGKLKFGIAAAKGGEIELTTPFTGTVRAELAEGANDFAFDAVFPENGRHALPVTLKRVGEDVTMARTYPVIVDYEAIRVKLSLPQYRDNFYPGQDASRIVGRVRFANGGKATARLVIPDVADETTAVGADGAFAFKVDDRGATAWDGRIEFRCGDDRKDVRVRKLAPLEGGQMSWVENGRLIVDGKPLFRRNMYAEYYRGGEAFKRRYDADDLHLTHNFRRIATLEPGRLIKGMEQKEATKDMKPCDAIFAKMAEVIEKGKDGKSGAYYYISDEPECRMVSPVYLKWMYEFAKEKDPYHVLVTCTRAGERYIGCADVLEPHPYINPYIGKDGRRAYGRDFNELGSFVDACKPESHPDKCIGGAQACFCSSRGISPRFDEYILNTWCLLLRGARTFVPYAYHDLGDNADLYEGTRYVFSSVEALADFFLDGSRQMLCKSEQTECGLWELGGEKLFAAINFTDRPQTVEVKGLDGKFTEFRGTRAFDFSTLQRFDLGPHESLVATTVKRDAGLPSYAATKELIAKANKARQDRGNVLFGRLTDVTVTASKGKPSVRKLFDGTTDVFAWGCQPKGGWVELSFPKFTPEFRRLAVHGWHLGDMKVKARVGGDWKELISAKRDSAEFREEFDFGESVRTVKLRFEFAQKQVELYEIELLGGRVETSAAGGARDRGESVPLGEVKTSENLSAVWTRPAGYDYLTFDFAAPQRIAPKAYTSWGVSLPKKLSLFSGVTRTLPGRYTLRLPPATGKKETYLWRTKNLALDIRDVRFAKEPRDRVDFTDKDGTYAIRLTLAEPCEDVVCEFLTDIGRGPSTFSVNGRSSCDLKPLDATRTVWGAEIAVKSVSASVPERLKKKECRPFVRVSVLGGGLDVPIFANVYKN